MASSAASLTSRRPLTTPAMRSCSSPSVSAFSWYSLFKSSYAAFALTVASVCSPSDEESVSYFLRAASTSAFCSSVAFVSRFIGSAADAIVTIMAAAAAAATPMPSSMPFVMPSAAASPSVLLFRKF